MPYKNLHNVRVIQKQVSRPSGVFAFIMGMGMTIREPDESSQIWIAVYHSGFGKWIATNDIEQSGLKEVAENLQIVGYAESLDGIMFVIWEHQLSLGLTHTVLDDIKRNMSKRQTEPSNTEWIGWNGKLKGVSSQGAILDELHNHPFRFVGGFDLSRDEDEDGGGE